LIKRSPALAVKPPAITMVSGFERFIKVPIPTARYAVVSSIRFYVSLSPSVF
jgi:hypothetical protein